MNKSKFTLLTASLTLATALTLSCSSDGGDEDESLSSGNTESSSSSIDDNGEASSSSKDNDGDSSSSSEIEQSSSSVSLHSEISCQINDNVASNSFKIVATDVDCIDYDEWYSWCYEDGIEESEAYCNQDEYNSWCENLTEVEKVGIRYISEDDIASSIYQNNSFTLEFPEALPEFYESFSSQLEMCDKTINEVSFGNGDVYGYTEAGESLGNFLLYENDEMIPFALWYVDKGAVIEGEYEYTTYDLDLKKGWNFVYELEDGYSYTTEKPVNANYKWRFFEAWDWEE